MAEEIKSLEELNAAVDGTPRCGNRRSA
jgi:hypothetical protein